MNSRPLKSNKTGAVEHQSCQQVQFLAGLTAGVTQDGTNPLAVPTGFFGEHIADPQHHYGAREMLGVHVEWAG